MTWCVVPGCRNIVRQSVNLVFYRFPKLNRRLLSLWLTAIGKENWQPHKWSAICCDHFTKNDFVMEIINGAEVKSLKSNAVPTKRLPKQQEPCTTHGHLSSEATFCCVEGCKVNSTDGAETKFHPLPIVYSVSICPCVDLSKNPSPDTFLQRNLQICQKHFVKNALMSYITEEGIDLTNDDDDFTSHADTSIKTYSIVTTASSTSTATTGTEAANNINLTPSAHNPINLSVTPNIFTKTGSRLLKQVSSTAPNIKVSKSKCLTTSTPTKRVDVAPVAPVVTSTQQNVDLSSWNSRLRRGDIILTNNNQVLQILELTDNVNVNDIVTDQPVPGIDPLQTSKIIAKQNRNKQNIVSTEEELSRFLQNGEEICRVCLSAGDLRPINKLTFCGEYNIFDMLNVCINLSEPIEKQFPQNICFSCLKNLKATYVFLKQCEKSTVMLQNHIAVTQEYFSMEHDYSLLNVKKESDDDGVENNAGECDGIETVDIMEEVNTKPLEVPEIIPINSIHDSLLYSVVTSAFEENAADYIKVNIGCGEEEQLCELTNKNISKKELPKVILDKIDDKSTIIADESIPKHIFNQITDKSTVQHDGKSYVLAKAYSCHKCKELFFDKVKLQAHNCTAMANEPKRPKGVPPSPTRLLKCKKCLKIFCSNQQLGKHVCRTITLLQCKKCKKRFRYGSCFSKHQCTLVPRQKKKFPCKVCKEVFLTSRKLTLHRNELHPIPKTHKCRRCNIVFQTREEFMKHGKEEHKSPSTTCPICHKTIKRENVSKHRASHSGELNFCCEYCGKRFKYPANLRHHHRMHLDLRPYACDICGKGFRIRAKVKEHRLIHFDERKYMCDVCGATFRQKVGLSSHKQKKRCFKSKGANAPPNPQECDICQQILPNRSQLMEHKKKEHRLNVPPRTKTFRCEVCNQQFVSKLTLNSHEYLHGTKTRKCTGCSRRFFTLDRLKQHMKVHLVERKVPCPHCDKLFTTTATLRAHMVVHTGERNYVCSFCSKTFAQSAHLMAHERTHTGQRPYQCPHCDRAFALSGNLTAHIRTHTGERPYECRFCPQAFYEASAAKKHMQTKHSLELIYADD